ncbi:unnamed protein product, partial [Mesorhabditis spiculigera]
MSRPVLLALFGLAAWVSAGPLSKLDVDGLLDDGAAEKFNQFKSRFGRKCVDGSADCKNRKRNFARNWKYIVEKNKTCDGYELGLTDRMDMSLEDKKKFLLGPDFQPVVDASIPEVHPDDAPRRRKRAVGATEDYRQYDLVNPIRSQGDCNSCWAFASVAAIEIQSNWVNGKYGTNMRKFSDQHVLDCTSQGDCISGGWPSDAIKRVNTSGVALLSSFPYKAVKSSSCPTASVFRPVTGQTTLTSNAAGTRDFIWNTGPVVACFNICDDINYYTNGIYTRNCKTTDSDYQGGHAITLIGYGTENGVDYWLARNQWGSNWGMSGYFKIKRGSNTANIENYHTVGPICGTI